MAIKCVPGMGTEGTSWGIRGEMTARVEALNRALNKGVISLDDFNDAMQKLRKESDIASNSYKGGWLPPRLNMLRTLTLSKLKAARDFARELFIDSSIAAYQARAVPAEAVGSRGRNIGIFNAATAYKEGFTLYLEKKGINMFERFGRAMQGAFYGTKDYIRMRLPGGNDKDMGQAKVISYAEEFRRLVHDYAIGGKTPEDSTDAAYQTALNIKKALNDFNTWAKQLGGEEKILDELLSDELPVFADVSRFRSLADKTAFVRAVTTRNFQIGLVNPSLVPGQAETIEQITVTPDLAGKIFDLIRKQHADYAYELELPREIAVQTAENQTVIVKMDYSSGGMMDDFIVHDVQATAQRYFTTMSHRVAMRVRGLTDENDNVHPDWIKKLEDDKFEAYQDFIKKIEPNAVIERTNEGVKVNGTFVTISPIDKHFDRVLSNMTTGVRSLAGRPPAIQNWGTNLSDAFPKAIQRLSQFNLVTKLAGIVVSASADLGGVAATLGTAEAKVVLRAMKQKGNEELWEQVHFMKAAIEANISTILGMQSGVNMNQTVRSGPLDSALNTAVQYYGTLTGIDILNDFTQRAAIFGVADGFVRELISGGDSVKFITLMQRWGIDGKMREEMKDLIREHGSHVNGVNSLGVEKWHKSAKDADDLARIQKLQNDTAAAFSAMGIDHTMLPFAGTLPEWAQNPASKLLLEFRTIIFSSWMRLVQAPIERGKFNNADVVALTANIGLGYTVWQAKNMLYGRPETDNEWDRAFGVADQMSHTALPLIALYGAHLVGPDIPGMYKPTMPGVARYLFGPTADTLKNGGNLVGLALGVHKWDNPLIQKALRQSIPFNNHPFVLTGERILEE